MRLIPGLSERDKLETIYINCRNEYKVYAKRHEFNTLAELLQLAETYESIMGITKLVTALTNKNPSKRKNRAKQIPQRKLKDLCIFHRKEEIRSKTNEVKRNSF